MSEQAKLLPCPFCGGRAWIDQWPSFVQVCCKKHKCADGPRRKTEIGAIAAWNRRKPQK